MTRRKKLDEVLMELYRELYRKSTPSADFDELVEKAEKDEFGKKKIPYMDYYLDDDEYKKTVDKYVRRYKSRGKCFTDSLQFNAYLGCGPTSTNRDNDD